MLVFVIILIVIYVYIKRPKRSSSHQLAWMLLKKNASLKWWICLVPLFLLLPTLYLFIFSALLNHFRFTKYEPYEFTVRPQSLVVSPVFIYVLVFTIHIYSIYIFGRLDLSSRRGGGENFAVSRVIWIVTCGRGLYTQQHPFMSKKWAKMNTGQTTAAMNNNVLPPLAWLTPLTDA